MPRRRKGGSLCVTRRWWPGAVGGLAATVSNAYNRPSQLSAVLPSPDLATPTMFGYAGARTPAPTRRRGRAEAEPREKREPIFVNRSLTGARPALRVADFVLHDV